VLKLFELHITDGSKYGIDPPGHIRGVSLRDISWAVEKPIVLKGFDSQHMVEDVTFENCTVAGRLLQSVQDPPFEIDEYIQNIVFKNRPETVH
jgi:hypothetical protein